MGNDGRDGPLGEGIPSMRSTYSVQYIVTVSIGFTIGLAAFYSPSPNYNYVHGEAVV